MEEEESEHDGQFNLSTICCLVSLFNNTKSNKHRKEEEVEKLYDGW